VSARPNKKNTILNAALKLFATRGCEAVSTKKIALEGAVSESLIFRHFSNKESLIKTLYERECEALQTLCNRVDNLEHPKVLLSEILSLPFQIKEKHYQFYKWHLSMTGHRLGNENPLEPLLTPKLIHAFKGIDAKHVDTEVAAFWIVFNGLTQAIILAPKEHFISVYNCLKAKYQI